MQCFLIMRSAPTTDTSALVSQIAEITTQVTAATVSLAFMATGRNVLLRVRSSQREFRFIRSHQIYLSRRRLIFLAWSTGKPQRMNGKVNGRIYIGSSSSPIELSNNDLHSYVVVNDGRAYVAISSIPASVGHSLQPLASLGGVIGWAFALEQPGYENGFSIIGKRM